MRIGIGSALILCLATGLLAQSRGTQSHSTQPVVVGTVGSVVYPGGAPGTPGVTRFPGSVVNPGGGGVHLVVPGQNRGVTQAPASRYRSFAYPVYIGGYYETPYISQEPAPALAPQQNVTVAYPPPAPVTPVIINHYYNGVPMNAESAPRPATPEVETTHYLIAFQDHTIYAANAYWVDGDTLHYFTNGNVHNQVSLSLVDRAFTERLNKEAGFDVKLPAAAK